MDLKEHNRRLRGSSASRRIGTVDHDQNTATEIFMSTNTAPHRTVRLIGLPTDVNSSFLRGTASAPQEIRKALGSDHTNGSSEIGSAFGQDVSFTDGGDLPLREEEADAGLIAAAVAQAVQAIQMPLCLGGDHSVSFPIVQALARIYGPVNLLHFDAHPDLYDNYENNPRSHASPFARIMEAGAAKRLVQVGIRTLNAVQAAQARRFGVEMVLMPEFTPAAVPVLDGPLYVSFDLDALDPSVAPGVSHYEPGGLTVREVIAVLNRQRGHLVGADIVEFNPVRDLHGMTAVVCAKLVREIGALAARNTPVRG
jgi:arginase